MKMPYFKISAAEDYFVSSEIITGQMLDFSNAVMINRCK